MISKLTKKRLKRYVFVDEAAASAYRQFQKENPEFDASEHPLSAASYVTRLDRNQYRRNDLSKVRRPKGSKGVASNAVVEGEASWRKGIDRPTLQQLFGILDSFIYFRF